jgi:membrane protease YdiL (CAAX protease family)
VEYGTSRAVFAAFGDPYAGLNFADVPTPSVIEVVFGLFGLPLGAGIVEELVYRGYPLPRMVALSEAAGWAC